MKIVTKAEFVKLPAGTLYREYEPCMFSDMRVKGDSTRGGNMDFGVLHLDWVDSVEISGGIDILFAAHETGSSFGFNYNDHGRDGQYNDKQLYAIYEPNDVAQLIELLQRIHGKAPPTA